MNLKRSVGLQMKVALVTWSTGGGFSRFGETIGRTEKLGELKSLRALARIGVLQ